MRKNIKRALLLLMLFALIGCRSPLNDHGSDYSSKIYAIYTDTPKTTLIFFGDKYQYVFPNIGANLAAILEHKDELEYTIGEEFKTSNLDMKISILSDTTPYLTLFMQINSENLNPQESSWLSAHGFKKASKTDANGAGIYVYNQQLKGVRYIMDSNKLTLLSRVSNAPLIINGRDFSYGEAPNLKQSPVKIEQNNVEYNGKIFTPLPF